MDMSTITAAYEGLKVRKSLLQGLFDIKIEAEAKQRVGEVMSKLGDAQDALFSMREELFTLQTENKKLRDQVAESENWNEILSQHELVKTSGGAVVFKFKGEPEHYACPSFTSVNSIQILQDNRTMSGKYRCVKCGAEYPINPAQKPRRIAHNPNPFV
jgi:predicted RNA-binding Zn-ribbon protein involved in translation (DUF1610 family)